jgi:spore coat protein U-like protein
MRTAQFAFALGFLVLNLAEMRALAATSTASFSVTATVQSTCLVSAPAAAFGPHTAATLTATTSHVSVSCTLPTSYSVDLRAAEKATNAASVRLSLTPSPEHTPGVYADTMMLTITY